MNRTGFLATSIDIVTESKYITTQARYALFFSYEKNSARENLSEEWYF